MGTWNVDFRCNASWSLRTIGFFSANENPSSGRERRSAGSAALSMAMGRGALPALPVLVGRVTDSGNAVLAAVEGAGPAVRATMAGATAGRSRNRRRVRSASVMLRGVGCSRVISTKPKAR